MTEPTRPYGMPDPFPELARLEALNAQDDPALVERLAGIHNNCAIWCSVAGEDERALAHFKAAADVLRQGLARFSLGKDAQEAFHLHLEQYAENLVRAGEYERGLAAFDEAVERRDNEPAMAELDGPLYRGIIASGRGFALEALGRHEEALAARVEAIAQFAMTEGNEYVPDFPQIATAHMLEYAEQSIRLMGD